MIEWNSRIQGQGGRGAVRMGGGFTLIDLVVVLVVLAAILLLLVPLLGKAKKGANIMRDAVDQRNIMVAAMAHAAGNKDWCPGVKSTGEYAVGDFLGKRYFAKNTVIDGGSGTGATTDALNNGAMASLLDEGSIRPDQMISASETGGHTGPSMLDMDQAEPADPGRARMGAGEVTRFNFSYALLQYGVPSLKGEWKCNQNQQTVLMGNRMIFTEGDSVVVSGKFNTIFSDPGSGRYKGSLVRGDGSTITESFKAADISAVFGTLKYNQLTIPPSAITFIPSACDATAVGAFGKSGPDLRNFEASATKGQLGSAND